ncbi:MAG: alanine racemase [Candidatus Delongbacteria bacterium]|nr:alanine racemase [Candidatus Delongbacteria bacterium]
MDCDWNRPATAEINLDHFEFNIHQIRKKIPTDNRICIAVKANAYGHGLVEISRFAKEKLKIDYLAVAVISEAIRLRKNKIPGPVLLFGGLLPEDIPFLFEYQITPSIINFEMAHLINQYALDHGRIIPVHVVVDTGMGRVGFHHPHAVEDIIELQSMRGLLLEGIYTHFPVSDDPDKTFTRNQIEILKSIILKLENQGIRIPIRHCANSAAIIDLDMDFFTMVRPGVMIYGLYPAPEVDHRFPLRQIMTLKSRIVYLKEVEAGRSISYGRTYIPSRRTIIATIPIGYGDGINRRLSSCGEALVEGHRVPIAGRVTMDQLMLDLGNLPDDRPPQLGDEVVLYGCQGNQEIKIDDVAQQLSTIPYEVTCWINERVPRTYFYQGREITDQIREIR